MGVDGVQLQCVTFLTLTVPTYPLPCVLQHALKSPNQISGEQKQIYQHVAQAPCLVLITTLSCLLAPLQEDGRDA